ncbi:MAG: hypothetical protein NT045_07925 [Candidatus Aureabacteria bacterium]|nr:hypothetical protein [Candidatus Auribacterota bacterium]
MGSDQSTGNWFDAALRCLVRALLLLICALGGMWGAHAGATSPVAGAACGALLGGAILLMERRIAALWACRTSLLLCIGLLAYVALLAVAAYSELFNRGWCNWLSP